MATLQTLKRALKQDAAIFAPYCCRQPLNDYEYNAGFEVLLRGPGLAIYDEFIVPQLCQLIDSLARSDHNLSVLEVGPGPRSVLGSLSPRLRRRVGVYDAFEPRALYAEELSAWLRPEHHETRESPFPCLQRLPNISQAPFPSPEHTISGDDGGKAGAYDIVLFCHSLYGLDSAQKAIDQALGMLRRETKNGLVVVFHRQGALDLQRMMCHRSVTFEQGIVRIADMDPVLNTFASFVTGFVVRRQPEGAVTEERWRQTCRNFGTRDILRPNHLVFRSPEIMMIFNNEANLMSGIQSEVPSVPRLEMIKNRHARLHDPICVFQPTNASQVQKCVRWALKHEQSLTVVGGGHSDHCLLSNVVAVDMSAFDRVQVLTDALSEEEGAPNFDALIVAGGGSKTGTIIKEAMSAGLTVPLGARPSVGAGSWIQGGIGHLSRLHGLACDSIIGVILVELVSGQLVYAGHVPRECRPQGAVRSDREDDILWMVRGAGSHVGIVLQLVFKPSPAPTFIVRNWVTSASDSTEACRRLSEFEESFASKLPSNLSADAYLYWDLGQLHLGITAIEVFQPSAVQGDHTSSMVMALEAVFGTASDVKNVNGLELFDTEMYISGMHDGHGRGKTSSFKRCVFLKDVGSVEIARCLAQAVESQPSKLCYVHLLQGGGAVANTAENATAFGCRDWNFACVITGVWPRDQDCTQMAQLVIDWVYDVAHSLLPLSYGAYGADLGTSSRDIRLAAVAFGPNTERLAHLQVALDPKNVLKHACPISPPALPPRRCPKMIFVITGDTCAGKDYCAVIWASTLNDERDPKITARVRSISEVAKRQYATAIGANFDRLLQDRAYKEEHRPALTRFFQDQVSERPRLPDEHFVKLVHDNADVDAFFITGMREKSPVAALSHLVPKSKMVEIHVAASDETRQARGCRQGEDGPRAVRPFELVFRNDNTGDGAPRMFAKRRLCPFFHADLDRLAAMVRTVADFPRKGIEFRHVLNIAQQPGGLGLCASLLKDHFTGSWAEVDMLACCEAGGFVFAAVLSQLVDVPLRLMRHAGKLPPPTSNTERGPSHISSVSAVMSASCGMEMEPGGLTKKTVVVVVDDVLASGKTLCATLELLQSSGVSLDNLSVMIVAEFPVHRGRELLRQRGFGHVYVQSLLVFDGA